MCCVLELKNNLLSVGQLKKKAWPHCSWMVYAIFIVYREEKWQFLMSNNKMFVLLVGLPRKKDPCTLMIWISLSFGTIVMGISVTKVFLHSYKNEFVVGLPQIVASYVACMKGKQYQTPIRKTSNWKISEKLQLVHVDVYGPITPTSNIHKSYALCFIDDFY